MVTDPHIRTAYLTTPSDWPARIHLVFHVSLLERAADDPFPGQPRDEVLDSRRLSGRWRKLQHLVKWSCHGPCPCLGHGPSLDVAERATGGAARCRAGAGWGPPKIFLLMTLGGVQGSEVLLTNFSYNFFEPHLA